ncbi:MAG: peptidoglycan editing factor PgeF [Syntrophomonadaceae bacterium]|jgi:YfiH family protein
MLNWIEQEANEIKYITIPEWLNRGVDIAFSTRRGGVSRTPFNSLNLGLHVGDQEEAVLQNRRLLLSIFGQKLSQMVCIEQVHGNKVIRIQQAHKGRGAFKYLDAIPGYDSMITNEPGIYLTSFYADCLPVCFFDPVKLVIGMAHSGWKGTMGRIVISTVEAMQREYGCLPEDMEVFMGPAIGRCCFEIQSDLAHKVMEEFNSLNDIIFRSNNDDKYRWDLRTTNRQLLTSWGINPAKILDCDICTACNTDKFFSYRREQGQTGRMGVLLALRDLR